MVSETGKSGLVALNTGAQDHWEPGMEAMNSRELEWSAVGLVVLETETLDFLEWNMVAGNRLESGMEEPGLGELGREEEDGRGVSGCQALDTRAAGLVVMGGKVEDDLK